MVFLLLLIFTCNNLIATEATHTTPEETSIMASPKNKKLVVLKSSEWRDKDTQPVQRLLKSHKPTRITVHHSFYKKKPIAKTLKERKKKLAQKMKNLYNYSVNIRTNDEKKKPKNKRKSFWGDIPYHFVMGPAGTIGEARDVKYKPDTNTSFNTNGHINIVVNGRYDNDKKGGDQLSSDQKSALITLIKKLQRQHTIPDANVGVHDDYAQTICPGENIKNFIRQIF